jgi:hypothetical protein
MPTTLHSAESRPNLDQLHESFQQALPSIQSVALQAFRRVRCPHERADLVAEAVALCWAWFLAARAAPRAVAVHLVAARAARAVRAGRQLTDVTVTAPLPIAV